MTDCHLGRPPGAKSGLLLTNRSGAGALARCRRPRRHLGGPGGPARLRGVAPPFRKSMVSRSAGSRLILAGTFGLSAVSGKSRRSSANNAAALRYRLLHIVGLSAQPHLSSPRHRVSPSPCPRCAASSGAQRRLLIPQGIHWIDRRRPARREQGCRCGRQNQQQRDRREGHGIGGATLGPLRQKIFRNQT